MKAIIGLGNPGTTYERTRHNIGFLVLDEFANRYGGTFTNKRSIEAELCEIQINDERILLVKPQTFMNVSGRAVTAITKKYPVEPTDLFIVYDDADLPFGDVRLKSSGGSAGHRGMESILSHVGKNAIIHRIRMGIGRPTHPDTPLDQFVLGKWRGSEEEAMPSFIDKAISIFLQALEETPS